MLEDLRRGHEGLMVKLNDVTRSLKVCLLLEVDADAGVLDARFRRRGDGGEKCILLPTVGLQSDFTFI